MLIFLDKKKQLNKKHKQFRKFMSKGKSFKNLTQGDCDLIALVINVETHLQNPFLYPIGMTVTKEKIATYKQLIGD